MNPENSDVPTGHTPSGCFSLFGLWVAMWLLIAAAGIGWYVHHLPQTLSMTGRMEDPPKPTIGMEENSWDIPRTASAGSPPIGATKCSSTRSIFSRPFRWHNVNSSWRSVDGVSWGGFVMQP
jgi:hypothetical protein